MSDPGGGPLDGTTVLDVSRMLPGAVLARMLVDLGARVIKVEQPGTGDPLRHAPPLIDGVGAGFCAFYRGAESLCLDLKQARGLSAFVELTRRVDVLVESFRPGTLASWGAAPESLQAAHPGLVLCSLSSYGMRGPDAARVGHDLNFVAATGLLAALPGDGIPGVQLADVATGMLACSAVLAALLARTKSGRGTWIDQPLTRGPLPFLTFPLAEAAAGAGAGGAVGTLLSGRCPAYRLYTCGDGLAVAVCALEPKFWSSFIELLELPEVAGHGLDPGPAGRRAMEQVQRTLTERPRQHWLDRARERGLPVTPVLDGAAAVSALGDAGLMERTPLPGGGALSTPGPYLPSVGTTAERPAPRLGEHTAVLLAEFRIDP